MFREKKLIAIIPVRKNSKGIKKKKITEISASKKVQKSYK